jgi:pyruvate dehydrogenase E2 component (dihydrolipoamide acetyltransferase)
MIEFRLPSLGSDMNRGTLLEWKVKPGDGVRKGDVVAVVDTSKTAIDVEIWQEGQIHELLLAPGQAVPVGTVIATLLEPGETAEQAEAQKRLKAAAPPPAQPAAAPPPAPVVAEARRRVSPAARQRAGVLNIDLAAVIGTGPDGAVTLEDVEKAALVVPPTKDRAGEMRRAIGAAMARSKREIPHYYLAAEVPLARASEWLTGENERRPVTERVLMAVLFIKAVALALRKYPELNGFYRNDRFEPSAAVHVGVAISLRQGGLIAPALHDADKKNLAELMAGLADLVRRTRSFSLKSSEMADPTVTLTNLGDQGVELVQGVIYPPQVALVGFGKVTERPWAENGTVRVLPVVTASLSADHRVSDGHRGALFLAELRQLLQQPEKL